MGKPSGSPKTREFYDEQGWRDVGSTSLDGHLFGVKQDGPIRIELDRLETKRIRASLALAGTDLELLECGCGGNPARKVMDLCSTYTGVDFSKSGIERSRAVCEGLETPTHFQVADVCALPFENESFDAVYSAHMIYHIDDRGAQAAALREMMRLLRPGGVAVVVTANPRPWLFPLRFLKRVIADAPILGPLLDRLRPAPPIPYRPSTIRWMRRLLSKFGEVEVYTCSIPSTAFYQRVSEKRNPGRALWRLIRWLEIYHPHLSAHLGNYVTVVCRKKGSVPRRTAETAAQPAPPRDMTT
jgi:ubiquinone/menaquinone biosynthesis C-methylase UbiE